MSYLIHTNNYEENKKQLQDKVRELVKLDPSLITEYVKLYARVKKYGDPDVILKTGRKPVSPEHKKETYRKYYEKVKQKREEERAQLDALGITYKKKMGRPKKNPSPPVEEI